MFRKQKRETIDFKTFLAGNRVNKPNHLITTSVFSIFPTITISSLSPDLGIFTILFGAGAFAMLSYVLENLAAHNGYESLAILIDGVTRLLFPLAGFGGILWFLLQL